MAEFEPSPYLMYNVVHLQHTKQVRSMVMLVPNDKNDDDYKQWGATIGMPSGLGVHLKVGISYSDRPGNKLRRVIRRVRSRRVVLVALDIDLACASAHLRSIVPSLHPQ